MKTTPTAVAHALLVMLLVLSGLDQTLLSAAPTMDALIAARAMQGLGVAA